mgnify:CR=1 FL=1
MTPKTISENSARYANILTFIPARRRIFGAACAGISFLLCVRVKTVADSSQCNDIFGAVPKTSAEKLNVCVEGAVVAVEVVAPNISYKFFSGKGGSGSRL